MLDASAQPVIAGLGVGIGFFIMFAVLTSYFSVSVKLKGDWDAIGQRTAVDVLLTDPDVGKFAKGKKFEVWAYGANFPQPSLKEGVCERGECTLIGIRERNADGSVDCALKTFVNVDTGRIDDVQYSRPCDEEPDRLRWQVETQATSFFIDGYVRNISTDYLTVTRNLDGIRSASDCEQPCPVDENIRLDKGYAPFGCIHLQLSSNPNVCLDKFRSGELSMDTTPVCAFVRLIDGEIYAGKIFYQRSCSTAEKRTSEGARFQPLVAEGVTIGAPYLVHISWDLNETVNGNGADLLISMKDKDSMEPLKEITYDFGYKGLAEGGGFQDQYVEDFSIPNKFRTGIKNPCEMHLTVFIDKVGGLSYASEELDTSSVLIQFRTFPENELDGCDANNIKLSLFNGYDLKGSRVPREGDWTT